MSGDTYRCIKNLIVFIKSINQITVMDKFIELSDK